MLGGRQHLPRARLHAAAARRAAVAPRAPLAHLAVHGARLLVAHLLLQRRRALLAAQLGPHQHLARPRPRPAPARLAALAPRAPLAHLAVHAHRVARLLVARPRLGGRRARASACRRRLDHLAHPLLRAAVARLAARAPLAPRPHLAVHRARLLVARALLHLLRVAEPGRRHRQQRPPTLLRPRPARLAALAPRRPLPVRALLLARRQPARLLLEQRAARLAAVAWLLQHVPRAHAHAAVALHRAPAPRRPVRQLAVHRVQLVLLLLVRLLRLARRRARVRHATLLVQPQRQLQRLPLRLGQPILAAGRLLRLLVAHVRDLLPRARRAEARAAHRARLRVHLRRAHLQPQVGGHALAVLDATGHERQHARAPLARHALRHAPVPRARRAVRHAPLRARLRLERALGSRHALVAVHEGHALLAVERAARRRQTRARGQLAAVHLGLRLAHQPCHRLQAADQI
mmetsp:Transcript_20016/g.63748  ORF Transcript_20016/g.63748 Transcript_20016/m.63748 type:complete len:461 (-) Transcript_20016:4858-6240(-)